MIKNILVVEDNQAHMKALEKLLSGIRDVKVFKAYNMAEACYMLSLHDYSVILVDLILDNQVANDLSGIRFVEMLRDNKKYEYTPVIIVTSLEDPKLTAFKELHCYDYIEKPYKPSQVLEVVENALRFPIAVPERRICYFRKEGILYSVKPEEVTYVEVSRRGVCIHTIRDELSLPYHSVEKIISELGEERFLRCSRGVIVSRDYIQYVDFNNRYLKIIGVDEPVEISSTMKRQLREALERNV
ncbi:MAG: response regulator [Lachnospiraceae bacterium]|nr:response regulator [Lachnospiraceae bacterium]